MRIAALFALAGWLILVPFPGAAQGRTPARTAPDSTGESGPADTLTLDQALAEARAANARLPIARLALQQSLDRLRQARGSLWPGLSLGGDLHPGAPRTYESSDARLQVVAEAPLYEGGALRAAVGAERARTRAARADVRVAVKDVELAVRADYAEYLRAQREIDLQRLGVERLQRYLAEVRSRQASGQGVGADVVKTRAQLLHARADLDAAEHARTEMRMELNDVLGRDPDAPLALAPLSVPSSPSPDSVSAPWNLTPDVQSALASVGAAEAGLSGARSLRLPHLNLSVAGGGQAALVDPAPALMNDGRGWGVEAMLSLSLPLWSHGVYSGRVDEARDALTQSRRVVEATRRAARLEYDRSSALLRARYREIQVREQARESARDAYLQAESLYRGGSGSALDVLDAYRTWLTAGQAHEDAVLDYRLARARVLRWGGP
ncbi:MAG: TolC family protein [Candidatus Palauibacterales bacterium]|nr:TolC family protein [Candidatus Palauibacterales bacterium]MDP2529185.1 TolC family protein [Candidatus Palauibacterales bacterium]MDP2582813.1 TolC family protein [Candidatus Palauibacterales bacterium]